MAKEGCVLRNVKPPCCGGALSKSHVLVCSMSHHQVISLISPTASMLSYQCDSVRVWVSTGFLTGTPSVIGNRSSSDKIDGVIGFALELPFHPIVAILWLHINLSYYWWLFYHDVTNLLQTGCQWIQTPVNSDPSEFGPVNSDLDWQPFSFYSVILWIRKFEYSKWIWTWSNSSIN